MRDLGVMELVMFSHTLWAVISSEEVAWVLPRLFYLAVTTMLLQANYYGQFGAHTGTFVCTTDMLIGTTVLLAALLLSLK